MLEDLAQRAEAELGQQSFKARQRAVEVDVVAKALARGRLDARLFRVEFPRVQVECPRASLSFQ